MNGPEKPHCASKDREEVEKVLGRLAWSKESTGRQSRESSVGTGNAPGSRNFNDLGQGKQQDKMAEVETS